MPTTPAPFSTAPFAPDFPGFADQLRRRCPPQRVYLAELFFDQQIKDELAERLQLLPHAAPAESHYPAAQEAALRQALGYDLTRVHLPAAEFRMDVPSVRDPAAQQQARTAQGYIVHTHGGPIQCWEDFEKYPWPDIGRLDLAPLEWAEKHLPEGMAAFDLTDQFFEALCWLLGYETLFVGMYEDEEFVAAVLEKVASIYLQYSALLCDFSCVGALWATDDLGAKSGPLVAPSWLQEHILPLHQESARRAHAKGKLYLLHSCGGVDPMMPAFIDQVGIDGKHSFEDAITPVELAYKKWGAQTGILGGLDIDFLARASPDQVRQKVKKVLEVCHHGSYALGTGNSVTNYIAIDNFLAMCDEAYGHGR